MIVLAIDTAGAACSVALSRDGAPVAAGVEPMTRGQAERLMPMVRSMTDRAGLRLADIDLFAVTVGPGAFTGLRIGLAAAAGMALAAGRPIIGIGNLEASVHAVPGHRTAGRTVLAALDSRRTELFSQPFDEDLTPLCEPACLGPADLSGLLPAGPVLVTGDAARTAAEALARLGSTDSVSVFESAGPVDPMVVATLAARRADQASHNAPMPVYLRPPDATRAAPSRPIAP